MVKAKRKNRMRWKTKGAGGWMSEERKGMKVEGKRRKGRDGGAMEEGGRRKEKRWKIEDEGW